jgi:hypothetical protein
MMLNGLSPGSNASRRSPFTAITTTPMDFDGVQAFDQSHAQSDPQD